MPHVHEKIDFVVNVYIVHKNRILLRLHDKYGIWLAPGGHVDLDEDPNEAALREVWEEVGLRVTLLGDDRTGESHSRSRESRERELIPPVFMNIHKISDTHDHIEMAYFATADTDEVSPQSEGDRSDAWKWVSKEELLAMDMPSRVREYCLSALSKLGG